MTPPDEHLGDPTPEDVAALGTLLLVERPRPSQVFAAELDARVAARFTGPRRAVAGAATASGRRTSARRRWAASLLQRPFLPAAAATLAIGLIALVVALSAGGGGQLGGAGSTPAVGDAGKSAGGVAAPAPATPEASGDLAAPAPERSAAADATVPGDPSAARKVERTASLELGTDADRIDDVAQGVLGVVARYDGIVDESSVQSGTAGGTAQFQLRIPAARLQPALAALSHLPDAHVLARTDDAADVNQAYVSVRRRLANARAERAGVVRALTNADTEDETLRLRARLDALERTIAGAERTQRALDRRVDWSRVSVAVRSDDAQGSGGATDDGSFTLGGAVHDALRVLEVAAGVVVIAAAALLPLALLAACAWPLARTARRRRREHALDVA